MTQFDIDAYELGCNHNIEVTEADTPDLTVSAELLEEARLIIGGDRREAYGAAEVSFNRIAQYWSIHTGVELKAYDVALMLILMKTSRTKTSPQKRDNWVDIIGYGALGGEVA